MRIKGGRDYYDQALAFGRDDDITFPRSGFNKNDLFPSAGFTPFEPDILKEPSLKIPYAAGKNFLGYSGEFNIGDETIHLSRVVVWFCGRRYGGMRRQRQRNCYSMRPYEPPQISFFWSIETFLADLTAMGVRILKSSKRQLSEGGGLPALELHFSMQTRSGVFDWLVDNRIAIAMRDANRASWGWFINADTLKNVEFQKCVGPFEAMQELSMFIGGVLPKDGPKVVEITDSKIKIAKHGFDEWSFRKEPSKRQGLRSSA